MKKNINNDEKSLKSNKKYNISFDSQMDENQVNIVSSNEATGMIYKPPITDDEVDAYAEIYSVRQKKDSLGQKAESPQAQADISEKDD